LTGNNFELSIDIHRGHSETGRERTQCFRKVLTNRLGLDLKTCMPSTSAAVAAFWPKNSRAAAAGWLG
jgi:hypothetical protein